MSDPFVGSVPLGMNSPVGQSEWSEFLRRRTELISIGMQQLGLARQMSTQMGLPVGPTFQATSLLMQQPQMAQQPQPVTSADYNRLLGAADFYGIDNAEVLDPAVLQQVIESRRNQLESRRMEEDPTVAGAIYDTIATFLGTTGLGAVDAVAGGLQRIPFVGDALRKHTGIENYQRGLAMLEEGFTGDMLDNERAAYEKFARPLQHFLGYSALVGVAAEGVGATGFAAGIANPLVRGGLQGAGTGWLLEGGGDAPISERAMKIALFSGIQGAAEWGLPLISARLARSFPRPSQMEDVIGARAGRPGEGPGTVDGEWAFFNEPAMIGGPPRQIGPAGMAGGAAPPGSPLLGPGGIPGRPIVPQAPVIPGAPPALGPAAGPMEVGAGMTSFPRGGGRLSYLRAEQASADAVSATKHGTILESPILPGLAKQPIIQDADVAIAAMATNPGQISIVQGVGDTAGTIRRFLQEFLPNGVGPQDFRAIKRGDRVDILVADGRTISNKMAKDYETFGMFQGQQAVTAQGQQVMIEQLGTEFSQVKSMAGSVSTVPTAELMPGKASLIADAAPEAYIELKSYAQSRMAVEAMDSGLDNTYVNTQPYDTADLLDNFVPTPSRAVISKNTRPGEPEWRVSFFDESIGELEAAGHEAFSTREEAAAYVRSVGFVPEIANWFSDEMATQIPRYIDEFLSMKGVEGTGARGVYTASFTEARVREFRALAPEEFAQVDAMQQEANVALIRRQMESGRSVSIEEIAETKGLRWEPTPNAEGGQLIDGYSGEVIPVDSREAAFAFLRDFNRTAPDYSPFSTVPAELLTAPAGAATPGTSAAPDYLGSVDLLVLDGVRSLDEIDRLLFYSNTNGGGGNIGLPPSGIQELGGGGNRGALPPGGTATPGDEFGQLRDASFGKWRRLEVRFDSSLRRFLEPMRGYAARVTEDLQRAGIQANYWDEITTIENSMAVGHNEMEPWVREFSTALAKIRNKKVRDGTVVLIGELPPEQAIAAMQNAGYTQREFEGQQQLRQLFRRVGDEYGVRRILDYWPHIRASDSPEMAVQRILRQDFEGPGRWFAEQIRQGGIDYREMNAEILINKWLRGAVFSRHVAPHVERMTQQWVQEPRIPENLRETTSDWLSLVTTGYVPGGDRIFDGVASIMQNLQIPVNTRDVETLVRWTSANVYRALLGGRPHAVLREMINPLMAWARIGNTQDLAGVMVRFARNADYRAEAVQRGLEGGWIMRYAHGRLAQEPFRAAGRASVPGIQVPENEFAPWQNATREGVAQVGDVFADLKNRVAPRGLTNSIVDPLMPMDRINEFGRLIAGESGYQSMIRALSEYNAARSTAGPLVDERVLFGQLLQSSGAANLHESVQRAIIQRITAGDQRGAATLMANESANQLGRLGSVDQPPALHRTGILGKWGTMFGNFAINYQALMREGMMSSGLAREFGGTSLNRTASGTKFLARHSMILGSLGLAAGYTGWNFTKWMWHGSLGWGGGPFLWAIVDGIRRNGARFKEANGEYLTPQERALLVETNDNLGQALVNPYMGYLQTIDRLGQASSMTNPIEAAGQYLVTGRMNGTEYSRQRNDAQFQVAPLPDWLTGQVYPVEPVVPPGTGGQF